MRHVQERGDGERCCCVCKWKKEIHCNDSHMGYVCVNPECFDPPGSGPFNYMPDGHGVCDWFEKILYEPSKTKEHSLTVNDYLRDLPQRKSLAWFLMSPREMLEDFLDWFEGEGNKATPSQ